MEGKGMFQPVRQERKRISKEETKQLLGQASFGTLACMGEDGYPYAVPLNYAVEGDCLYFHSGKVGHKVQCLAYQNKVCFSVVAYEHLLPANFDTEYDSVAVFGQVEEVCEEKEKRQALTLLIRKYSPDHYQEGMAYIARSWQGAAVYRIQMTHVTGKRGR